MGRGPEAEIALISDTTDVPEDTSGKHESKPILIRLKEAARRTGVSFHFLRKTFMSPTKKSRPNNSPPPPPHKRIGRVIYVIAATLPAWVARLPSGGAPPPSKKRRGGRTKAELVAKRQAALQGQRPGDKVGPSPGAAARRRRRGRRRRPSG